MTAHRSSSKGVQDGVGVSSELAIPGIQGFVFIFGAREWEGGRREEEVEELDRLRGGWRSRARGEARCFRWRTGLGGGFFEGTLRGGSVAAVVFAPLDFEELSMPIGSPLGAGCLEALPAM